ncbi:hypothetical protein [Anaerovorax odorimutans]|uniref:hypothetical protein n=1 Tax=Anaerovorax odorimutans TaxID=109327 RepID=UPI00042603AA|nr:hypothetical protein [Anaerovorax odorimutans]
MSILKALQDFLLTYDGMILQMVEETETGITIEQINTDITEENPTNYAITPTGNSKISTDILGNKKYSNDYAFYAKEYIAGETDRQEVHTFLEGFSAWIDKQNDDQNFPEMPIGYTVEEIIVSNILMLETEDNFNTGIYQVQIKLNYKKEV